MKKIAISFTFLLILTLSVAQNPICPPGKYIADPSAHVWKDGKLYIYGSTDKSCDYYCSWQHDVLVTKDMKNWQLIENRFASKGINDQIPYTDALLFAPDCQYKNGKYYLYYCSPDLQFTEGVASSGTPTGPFVGGKNIDLNGYNQIDPAVFIDDDDKVYYIWGQFTVKIALLKGSMTSLDISTIKDSILTEKEHHFHEGAFMTKRNGIYYLVFADISRADMPTCIGYATSKNPLGPYKYKGVIVDNKQCNPGNWNNHGSIAEFNGKWYVFYHRSTHACNTMRKACVEPIEFMEDGTIPEVEMTSQGAGVPFASNNKIEAERACLLFGNVRIEAVSETNEALTQCMDHDKAVIKYVNFNNSPSKATVRFKPGALGGKIILSIDQPWHQQIGELTIPETTNTGWTELTFSISKASDTHALWFRFEGEQNTSICWIDWIKFHKE